MNNHIFILLIGGIFLFLIGWLSKRPNSKVVDFTVSQVVGVGFIIVFLYLFLR